MQKLLIEQHFHGAFGVNFSNCTTEEVLTVATKIKAKGIGIIFPTLVTDTIENIKKQIAVIKKAAELQTPDMAKIYGIHLEGIFLNPKKSGIHNSDLFMMPTVENYKKIEDDFIKIVTIAPEFDTNGELRKYLILKGVKVQAGHCIGGDLTDCTGATHLFNAMSGITHRGTSTTLSALNDDNIYIEIIADGIHLSDDILKLIFKTKPLDKIILISDCLPCAGMTKKECQQFEFAGKTIYYDGVKAVSKDGTLAGSANLLPNIIERLKKLGLYSPQLIENSYKYHNIN